jgi:hypothetical protein
MRIGWMRANATVQYLAVSNLARPQYGQYHMATALACISGRVSGVRSSGVLCTAKSPQVGSTCCGPMSRAVTRYRILATTPYGAYLRMTARPRRAMLLCKLFFGLRSIKVVTNHDAMKSSITPARWRQHIVTYVCPAMTCPEPLET